MSRIHTFLFILAIYFTPSLSQTELLPLTGNEFYTIFVDGLTGLFTVATGPEHPAGEGLAVLWGGDTGEPVTSYASVFVYESNHTYVNSDLLTILLNDTDDVTTIFPEWIYAIGPVGAETGYAAKYSVNGSNSPVGDEFAWITRVQAVGTTAETAQINLEIQILNGPSALTFATRWILDYQVGEDDGPTFKALIPDSGRYSYEREWREPDFKYYEMQSNKAEEDDFKISSVAAGDGKPYETPVDLLQFASWEQSFYSKYQYDINSETPISNFGTNLDDDSCVLVTWGKYEKLVLGAEETTKVRTHIFLSPDVNPLNITCDDEIPCTYNYLHAREFGTILTCVYIPSDYFCDDGDNCTIDTCDQTNGEPDEDGCLHTPIDCDDQIPCTDDFCADGACQNVPRTCNDDIDCTFDYCDLDLGRCVYRPVDDSCLEFTDLCHIPYCSATDGCILTPVDCDDDIPCTEDLCDPNTGCYYVANNTKCNDDINCTIDICSTDLGKCVNTPSDEICDTGDCSIDRCDVSEGCISEPIDCTWDVPCSIDLCVSGQCIHVADGDNCDDGVECTVDVCDFDLGKCTNYPLSSNCDDNDPCTDEYCDPVLGCVYREHDCDDEIACTTNNCITGYGCVFNITEDFCNDGVGCTEDICDLELGKCTHVPDHEACDSGDGCTLSYCDVHAGCKYEPVVCDDEIWCSLDVCNDGECSHIPVNEACDDGAECTEDYCSLDVGVCVNAPIDSLCNDENGCTRDYCDGSTCQHVLEATCTDGIECTNDYCDLEDGCVSEPVDSRCDDGIPCTTDYCDPDFGCRYTPNHALCDVSCGVGFCDVELGCVYQLNDTACDDGFACSEDKCTPDGCVTTIHSEWCDDGIGCTADVCQYGRGCEHNPIDARCSDGRACSIEVCHVTLGCLINDSSCAVSEGEYCINCEASQTRIISDWRTDGTADLSLRTRPTAVPFGATASPKGLVQNVLLKGTGQMIFGGDDVYTPDDGVVISVDSNFRLIPTDEELPPCNEVTRGLVIVLEEPFVTAIYHDDDDDSVHEKVDRLHICLKTLTSYEWIEMSP